MTEAPQVQQTTFTLSATSITTPPSSPSSSSFTSDGKELVEDTLAIVQRLTAYREENDRLKTEIARLRGVGSFTARYVFAPLKQWAGPLAIVGWLVLALFIVTYAASGVVALRHYLSGGYPQRIPFDPVMNVVRTGTCAEEPQRLCVEMPTAQALNTSIDSSDRNKGRHTRVAFWNSTRDASVEARFKHMYATAAREPSYTVVTSRGMVDLRSIRDNLQRRVYRGDFAFACATFLSFPIDYCVFYIHRNSTQYSYEWVDVIGDIVITTVDYDTNVVTASVPSGLCEHAGDGQSPTHLAKYFSRVCVVYRMMNLQRREDCVTGMDAVTVLQLYEMQRGMVACCDDGERLSRLLARFRRDSVSRM